MRGDTSYEKYNVNLSMDLTPKRHGPSWLFLHSDLASVRHLDTAQVMLGHVESVNKFTLHDL